MPTSISSDSSSLRDKYPLLSGGFCENVEQELSECDIRFNFLLISCICMGVVGICGILINTSTHSDMVLVDILDMCADVFGLLLSMKIEMMKRGFIESRTKGNELKNRADVLMADAIGGLVSFSLLLSIVVVGALVSVSDIQRADLQEIQVRNRKWILMYAFISIVGDVIPLTWFFKNTSSAVARDQDSNKLNILSGLLHIGIDCLRAVVTFATTLIMLFTPTSKVMDTEVDGYGSLCICILVLSSAVWVGHEAAVSFQEVHSLNEEGQRLEPDSFDNSKDLRRRQVDVDASRDTT